MRINWKNIRRVLGNMKLTKAVHALRKDPTSQEVKVLIDIVCLKLGIIVRVDNCHKEVEVFRPQGKKFPTLNLLFLAARVYEYDIISGNVTKIVKDKLGPHAYHFKKHISEVQI